jgi:hypothetical protein
MGDNVDSETAQTESALNDELVELEKTKLDCLQ